MAFWSAYADRIRKFYDNIKKNHTRDYIKDKFQQLTKLEEEFDKLSKKF